MFCSKCGKNLSDDAKFCPGCGAPANSPAGGSGPAGSPAPEPPAAGTKGAAPGKGSAPGRRGKKALPLAAALVAAAALTAFAGYKLWSPDGPAEQGPDVELLTIIDEVKESHDRSMEEFRRLAAEYEENADSMTFAESLEGRVQALAGFLTDLERLRGEADAISGLDGKLAGAKDEYFNMLCDGRTAHVKTVTFLMDYFEFCDAILCLRPLEVDYDDASEYAQALGDWLRETRERYAAISYPSTVSSEWEQYGAILEYNADIVKKLKQALQYGDVLRLSSARNLTDRYNNAEKAQYKKLLECLDAENQFANSQYSVASRLAEEISAYVEMPPADREAYEFEYIRTGEVLLGYDVVDTIYPSLYNTYDAFAILRTGCISGKKSIIVEAEIEGFTQKYQQSFHLDSSYQAIYIKPPALTGELNLTTAKPAQLKIIVTGQDGTPIDAKTFDVTLKSKNDFEWYSDEYGTATKDNILCFLTPESSAITALKRQAIDEMAAMTDGGLESFVGYQNVYSDQYLVTYLQAAGLMSALRSMGVRYNMDPFSISGSNQHILLPEEVIAQRGGLCVETALTIASALQSANMHAFLIFPPGHAQVAVEVWNSGSRQGEYFLIETTALGSENSRSAFMEGAGALLSGEPLYGIISYYDAARWEAYLDDVLYVIDCDDSRLLGLTPFAN